MQSTRLSLNANQPFYSFLETPCFFAAEGEEEQVVSEKDKEDGEKDAEGGAGGSDQDQQGGDPQKKIKAQQEEIDRHYLARKKAEEERDQLKTWKEEQDRKGRTEIENLKTDLEKSNSRITELLEANKKLTVKNAFLQEKDYEWHNTERALASVDLSAVEVNEDGSVKNPDALKAAIKKLADEEPYMLKQKTAENESDPPGTGNPPAKKPVKQESQQKLKELKAKYPALRTRG